MDPQPVLLQPTVYDPHSPTSPEDRITAVQRNLEKEEAHRLLAEDEGIRAGALRRAKEAVLAKLSWEYRKVGTPPPPHEPFVPPRSPPLSLEREREREMVGERAGRNEVETSAAAAAVGRDFLAGGCGGVAAGMAMGMRFREGIFKGTASVLSDHRGLESQTALVPLMFSRS